MNEPAEHSGRRILVLLADDDEGDRLLVHEAWSASGIPAELQSVGSGLELLDWLRPGSSRRPDLILLDLEMPGMDGRDVLEALRTQEDLRRIPVVMLSSCSLQPEIGLCYALGARSYISKPPSFDGLVDIVRSLADYWFGTVRLPNMPGECPAGTG